MDSSTTGIATMRDSQSGICDENSLSQVQRDNAEFNISVLDSRYLGGDRELFGQLRNKALPHMIDLPPTWYPRIQSNGFS